MTKHYLEHLGYRLVVRSTEDMGRQKDVGAVCQPLYGQVRDQLISKIAQGEWAVGEFLPNEFKLASSFGVSIGTVRRALAALDEAGLIDRVQGRGTFVAGQGPHALIQKFEKLRLRDGSEFVPRFQLVSVKRVQLTATAAAYLEIEQGEPAHVVTQIMYFEETPIGVTCSEVPVAAVPRLDEQSRFRQHLYPLLAECGLLVVRTEDVWSAEIAGDTLAQLLGDTDNRTLLSSRRVAYTANDSAIEYRTSAFLSSKVEVAHVEQGSQTRSKRSRPQQRLRCDGVVAQIESFVQSA